MSWGFHLQEGAEHHQDHDNKELKARSAYCDPPKGHGLDRTSNTLLSRFIGKVKRAGSEEGYVVIPKRSEYPREAECSQDREPEKRSLTRAVSTWQAEGTVNPLRLEHILPLCNEVGEGVCDPVECFRNG